MATLLREIDSPEWAISVAGFGEIAEGGGDLDQCIQVICSTAKGSDPLRPLFGSDIWRHISKPLSIATPLIVREMLDAIASWEPRVQVTAIERQQGETPDELQFGIKYVRAGNTNENSARITIQLSTPAQQAPAAVQPPVPPVEVPASLTADYVAFEGALAWSFSDPLGFSFEIFRKAGGGAFAQIATVANVAEYTDSTVEFDTLYTYVVRSVKGARKSAFSNEATLQTLEPVLEFSAVAPEYVSVTKTGTAAVIESASGVTKVYAIDEDPENISAFYADDAGDADMNARITGTLDLSGLSGMRTVRARNQSFIFVPGTWVRNASVSIDVSNSITTASRVTALIDAVIVANGGTTTDDGSNYTGVPGQTHAGRVLNIGSIELDLGDPANTILYEKAIALGTVGWTVSTVSTVCSKSFDVNTGGSVAASAEIEKTRQLDGIVYGSGGVMDVSLYDTLANAQAGTSTGRLANGYALTDAWLRNNTNYNAWVAGTLKAMRFYAADGVSVGNASVVRYKAAPTMARPCGTVTLIQSLPTGAVAWYDFSDASTLGMSGSLIVSASDKSGNGRTIAAPAIGSAPQRIAGAYNGLDIARFDGINDYMAHAFSPPLDLTNRSFFIVAKYTPTNQVGVILALENIAFTNLYWLAFDNFFAPGITVVGERLPASTQALIPFSSAGGLQTFGAISYRRNATDNRARFNNDAYYTAGAGTGTTVDYITLARTIFSGGSDTTQCEIGEVLLYDRALSDAEMNEVTNYLINKWGL